MDPGHTTDLMPQSLLTELNDLPSAEVQRFSDINNVS